MLKEIFFFATYHKQLLGEAYFLNLSSRPIERLGHRAFKLLAQYQESGR